MLIAAWALGVRIAPEAEAGEAAAAAAEEESGVEDAAELPALVAGL